MGKLSSLTVVVCLLAALWPHAILAAAICPTPNDARQAQLDASGVATAQSAGLALNVAAACQGFSVVVQDGVDATDYVTYAEQAYTRLVAETRETLSPRAVLFVFANQSGMADGERVVAGVSSANREPRAGYAYMNTIWLDNSQHRSTEARARAVSHEFSHLFAATVARGKHIPNWFDEGLAVDSEVTLPGDQFAAANLSHAADERTTLLDAVSGQGTADLFALDGLSTGAQWQQHYRQQDEQDLEYAQAYETVQAAIANQGGRAAAWRVLRALGASDDFPSAFQSQLGRSIDEVDAAARADWQAQLDAPPQPLTLTARTTSADGADIDVDALVGSTLTHVTGHVGPNATSQFDVLADGTFTTWGGDFSVDSETVGDGDEAFIDVTLWRSDGTRESVSMDRSYGVWEPLGPRELSSSEDAPAQELGGAVGDPFPSGDRITPN
jgi:hypothetical protein